LRYPGLMMVLAHISGVHCVSLFEGAVLLGVLAALLVGLVARTGRWLVVADQPRTSDPVGLRAFTSDPFIEALFPV
jgi:hypothetical protein